MKTRSEKPSQDSSLGTSRDGGGEDLVEVGVGRQCSAQTVVVCRPGHRRQEVDPGRDVVVTREEEGELEGGADDDDPVESDAVLLG